MPSLDQLWAACERYRGLPYVFGGKDVARDGGLDCSGFVVRVFADIGVNLGEPGYTSAQKLYDNAVETGDGVRPGDLIFFTGTYAPADPVTHVGIIREPQPAALMWNANEAQGVALSNYGSSYWQEHYYGHRRATRPAGPAPHFNTDWSPELITSVTGASVAAVRANWPPVREALVAAGQGSRNSLAGAIATIAIETDSTFEPVEEAYWLPLADRLAYYADTSQHAYYGNYWGRGLIQLTLESNYRAAGDALGVDLVGHPDLALDPQIAARVFAWYWAGRNIQEAADRGDWQAVRRRVQGGSAGLPRLIAIVTALLS